MSQDEKRARRATRTVGRGPRHVVIGYDTGELDAYAVAVLSCQRHTLGGRLAHIHPTRSLDELRHLGLYWRDTTYDEKGRLFDTISGANMSTEFAIARFLAPKLVRAVVQDKSPYKDDVAKEERDLMRLECKRYGREGWVLFMDCDVLVRHRLDVLFEFAETQDKAIVCVKHNHVPTSETKMDNQVQHRYNKKNWSSVMLFNLDHLANRYLTIDLINKEPGRELHRFCWLDKHGGDELIGELHPRWNWLVNYTPPIDPKPDQPFGDPAVVHFTEGTPSMKGHENDPFADEWRNVIRKGVLNAPQR